MGRTAKDVQEVGIVLRPSSRNALDAMRPPRKAVLSGSISTAPAGTGEESQVVELIAENKRLRASLEKAIKINDKMWIGIVDKHLLPQDQASQANGHS